MSASSRLHFSLADLIDRSGGGGWSATTLTNKQISNLKELLPWQAKQAGYELVPNRQGQSVFDTLRPMNESQAHPNSLSSRYGHDQQPLHTDGAHHAKVPDLILLWAEGCNDVPTRIWRPRYVPPSETCGIFSVTDGKHHWVSGARDRQGNYRFDPGCMRPLDHFSRLLWERFQNPPEDEIELFRWDAPNSVLLIRNGVVLHGRSFVEDRDLDRELHRVAMRRMEK